MHRPVRAAVFDCDGLLVDTTKIWHDAFAECALSAGLELSADHHAELLGASVTGGAAAIAQWTGDSRARDDIEHQLRCVLERATETASLVPLPGVRDLLHALAGRMPLAVASNAPRAVLAQVLIRAGLAESFDAVVSADDVSDPKPAPDPYIAAAMAIRVLPGDCVALEDSPAGGAAARAAGMQLIIANPDAARLFDSTELDHDTLVVDDLTDPTVARFLRG